MLWEDLKRNPENVWALGALVEVLKDPEPPRRGRGRARPPRENPRCRRHRPPQHALTPFIPSRARPFPSSAGLGTIDRRHRGRRTPLWLRTSHTSHFALRTSHSRTPHVERTSHPALRTDSGLRTPHSALRTFAISSLPNQTRNTRQNLRMHESDRSAVAQVCGGDGNAFQSLVERHSKYVFHVAYRLTGSSQDAEDVVQETFLKAYRQLSRFEARADFRTWLHRITVNCSIDFIRARRSARNRPGPLGCRGRGRRRPVARARARRPTGWR